jgi:hypothetical protein
MLTLCRAASSSKTLKDSSLILKDLVIVFLLFAGLVEDLSSIINEGQISYLSVLSSCSKVLSSSVNAAAHPHIVS